MDAVKIDQTTFFIIVSGLWIVTEIVLARLKRSGREGGPDKNSLRILWTTIVLSITSGTLLAREGAGTVRGGREVLLWSGPCLIVAGLLLRWVSIAALWQDFTVDVSVAHDQKLVTGGLYRYVRHPSYTGSLLSFLGLGLAIGDWAAMIVIWLPITAEFIYRIRVEEKALEEHFGEEYRRYRGGTKRLIPKLY